MKFEEINVDGLNFFDSSLDVKIPKLYWRVCLVFAERRGFVIIFRITMNAIVEKRIEVRQTLLSMIEPTQNEKGCLRCHVLRDIENKNSFDLIADWETQEDVSHFIRSDRFSVLLGTKSLLYEPPQIQIHMVSRSAGMEAVNAVRG